MSSKQIESPQLRTEFKIKALESYRISVEKAGRRCPLWVQEKLKSQMLKVYRYAAARNHFAERVLYRVEHIVPLNGKHVQGLHVPWNLRVAIYTETENGLVAIEPNALNPAQPHTLKPPSRIIRKQTKQRTDKHPTAKKPHRITPNLTPRLTKQSK